MGSHKCPVVTVALSLAIISVMCGVWFGVTKPALHRSQTELTCQVRSISIVNTTCSTAVFEVDCYVVHLEICTASACNTVEYKTYEDYQLARSQNFSDIPCYVENDPTLVQPGWTSLSFLVYSLFVFAILGGGAGVFAGISLFLRDRFEARASRNLVGNVGPSLDQSVDQSAGPSSRFSSSRSPSPVQLE